MSPGTMVGVPTDLCTGLTRVVDETIVEALLEERLVDGCVLMDKSCPACVTPLVKQTEEGLDDDNSLKLGGKSLAKSSRQTLTPIDGVPFCVACQCHVVSNREEARKVEANTKGDKVLVGTQEEPADNALADDVTDIMSEQHVLTPQEQWQANKMARSHKIWNSASSHKPVKAQKSSKKSTRVSGKQDGERAKSPIEAMLSAFSMSPRESEKEEDASEAFNFIEEKPEQHDETTEKNEDDDDDDEVEQEVEAAAAATSVVKEVPSTDKIGEINVKKYCSVDAEDLTAADILTMAESEEELLSFEEKKSIAARALGVKIMKGYCLLEKQCADCKMPLTEYKGTVNCVVCPILKTRVEKIIMERNKAERERIRSKLEAQLQHHREKRHPISNKTEEEKQEEETNLDEPEKVNDTPKSGSNGQTHSSTPTHQAANVEKDSEEEPSNDDAEFEDSDEILSAVKSFLSEEGVEIGLDELKKFSSDSTVPSAVKPVISMVSEEGMEVKLESLDSFLFDKDIGTTIKDRHRPKRPVMGILKVAPQPHSLHSGFVGLSRPTKADSSTVSLRSATLQPGTKKAVDELEAIEEASPRFEKKKSPKKLIEDEDGSYEESTNVSSLHSDSTISTKSHTFLKKIHLTKSRKHKSIESIDEGQATDEVKEVMQLGTEKTADDEDVKQSNKKKMGDDVDVKKSNKEQATDDKDVEQSNKETMTEENVADQKEEDENSVEEGRSKGTASDDGLELVLSHTEGTDSHRPDSPSEANSKTKHWALLRAEKTALLTRRCIVGWKILHEQCKGKECRGSELVGLNGKKECVICGGTGNGKDGVYALLAANEAKKSTPPSILQSVVDSVQEMVGMKKGDASSDGSASSDSTYLDLGVGEISVVKSLTSALSFTVMPVRAPRHAFQPGTDILQVHREFENRRSDVSKQMALKMSQGWTLLNTRCPQCVMPLMSDPSGRNEICLVCGITGKSYAGAHSIGTAPTDLTSGKSTEDEVSTKSGYESGVSSGMSVSSLPGITDRIIHSSIQARRPSPRGDPPAVRHSPRNSQLEVEDSRNLVSGFVPVVSAADNEKARGPSPRYTIQPRRAPLNAGSEDEAKEDDYIIVIEDDETEIPASGENKAKQETNTADDESKAEKESVDESQVFAIAVPRNFNVGEGHAVVELLNAAKAKEAKYLPDSDRDVMSPSAQSAAAYRLPSPGMTEVSLPHMSPSSRAGSQMDTKSCPSSSSSCASAITQQLTQLPPTPNANKKPPTYQQRKKMVVSRDPPIPNKDGLVSCASNVSSLCGSRRKVTPELPAGRPRGYVRTRPKRRHQQPPAQAVKSGSPASQEPTPLVKNQAKKMFDFDDSQQSVVSALSNTDSPVHMHLQQQQQEPIVEAPDDEVASTAHSVTSQALDELLLQIEETQAELLAVEKEPEGCAKQCRLQELQERLAAAAAAMQALDG